MRPLSVMAFMALACVSLVTLEASAATALSPQESESLKAFADTHDTCLEWGDGCAICRRTEGSAFGCSLPGIACQPQALSCRDPMPSK